MKMLITQKGMPEVQEMVAALGSMGSAYRGIVMNAHTRSDGKKTNADVVEYLAEGGRDITATSDEKSEAAMAFVAVAKKMLAMYAAKAAAAKPTSMKTAQAQASDKKAKAIAKAKQAAALAFRAAAKVIQGKLQARIEAGEDNEMHVTPVSPEYAKARSKKYGIPESEDIVLRASGQLLDNAAGSGGLRLIK